MLELLLDTARAILALAALLTLVRVIRGPTTPDRVVALDLVGILTAGFVVVSAAASGSSFFLDVAIVVALISFVGTIAYARYVEISEEP